jgi:hypothetical protein
MRNEELLSVIGLGVMAFALTLFLILIQYMPEV